VKIYNFKMLVIADAGACNKDMENFRVVDGETSLGGKIVNIHEDEESQYIQLKNCEYVGNFIDFELGCMMGFKWNPEKIAGGVVAVDFTNDHLSLKEFKTVRDMADISMINDAYSREEVDYVMASCWNMLKSITETEKMRRELNYKFYKEVKK